MALLVRFPARRFQWFLIAASWLPLVQTVFPRRSALTSAQLPDPPRATKFGDEDSAGYRSLVLGALRQHYQRGSTASATGEARPGDGKNRSKIHFPSEGSSSFSPAFDNQ